MLTYRQMEVLMQHLTSGVLKQSEQTDMDLTYSLVREGMLQQVGAARMWVVTRLGADTALRNRFSWRVVRGLSNMFALSDSNRDKLFYAVCKF